MTAPDDADERELRARFELVEHEVSLGGAPMTLLRPVRAEDLISEADFARDERLPYWAELWPSSHALAERVAALDGAGRRFLELGCGLGLVSIAALRAGFDALATDYYDDALAVARVNARRATGRALGTRLVDWRAFPDDLGTFDRVVASDVLYERPYAALVAEAIARTLAPHGEALVTDPGRVAAADFVRESEARGLAVAVEEPVPWRDAQIVQRIRVYRLRRA